VDFVASARDGQPVTDLREPDQLKVGGKRPRGHMLEQVRFGAAASTLPAPFATNATSDAEGTFRDGGG